MPSEKHIQAITAGPRSPEGNSAYHEVLHPIAELVDEQDGEVVHGLPKLDPGGEAEFSKSL